MKTYITDAVWDLRCKFREVGFIVPILILPSFLFLLYGVLAVGHHHPSLHSVFHAFSGMVVLESMSLGVFAAGVVVAQDRQSEVLRLKRLYPTPPGTYMVANILSTMVILFLSLSLLTMLLAFTGDLPPFGIWLEILFYAVIGVAPFGAIGLTLGLYAGARAAAGIANVVVLFLGFASGLFVSLRSLPDFFQTIISIWPSRQLYDLCYGAISGITRGSQLDHGVILAGETLLLGALAIYKWKRVEL